jgi:hypothetical protein
MTAGAVATSRKRSAVTGPADVILNGTFASSSNWSGAGSNGRTISGGTANFTASTNASDGGFNQDVTGRMVANKYYELTWTILNRTAGDVTAFIFNGSSQTGGTFKAANGTYQERILAPSGAAPTQFGFKATAGSPTTLSVDNVSLIGPYDTATVGGA